MLYGRKDWAVFTKVWDHYKRKITIIKRFLSHLFTSLSAAVLGRNTFGVY